jgi:hypothetical protein
MSKGSDRRPRQITETQEEDNWSRIFGKKEKDHFNHLLHDSEEDKFPDDLTKQD